MAHVVGIPLIKGNNQEIRSVKIGATSGTVAWFEGQASFFLQSSQLAKADIEPVVTVGSDANAGNFAGFIFDINVTAGTASLIERSMLVALPIHGSDVWAEGEPIKVDKATSKISKTGSLFIDAHAKVNDVDAISGNSGAVVKCALIDVYSTKSSTVAISDAPDANLHSQKVRK